MKTRLAKDLGRDQAAEAYKLMVSRVFSRLRGAPLEAIRIVFDPPDSADKTQIWLQADTSPLEKEGIAVEFSPQAAGDLGIRLESAFKQAFSDGFQAVTAIGTDCIDLTADHIAQTWQSLDDQDGAVFGPTEDGGYYLIGLSAHYPQVFQEIPWSTHKTLARSIEQAEGCGLKVTQLECLNDVDEIADWNRVKSALSVS